jgi:putative ATPase
LDLFSTGRNISDTARPLADRMRPQDLSEFVGQEKLLAPGRPLRESIEADHLHSMILWGPPGSGKTTLAGIIARKTESRFVPFSAVLSGIKEIKAAMEAAETDLRGYGKRTIIFIDEIHRLNKAQQDAFLPYAEKGQIILIGATTENPSFELNPPLLSRMKVYILEPLGEEALEAILRRALRDTQRGLGRSGLEVPDEAIRFIARVSDGDARRALNVLERADAVLRPDSEGRKRMGPEEAGKILERKTLPYDKGRDEHYNIVSAFIKSMRNSDPHAAVYWLARMVEGGEDPLFIARRMVIFAAEDIGNADPQALSLAVSAMQAVHFVGMPEGYLPLTQAATYLATAPKSNAALRAYHAAKEDVLGLSSEPVPLRLRNAPTRLMKDAGYGEGYRYAHDYEEGVAPMDCLPDRLKGRKYYTPRGAGREKQILERMTWVEEKKKKPGK